MSYWIEVIVLIIPGLLFSLIFFMLPLNIGLFATIRHLRRGRRISYLKNLFGSIAAGIITLLILYGSLFGDDLSSSSTAALVFLFAPIYAAIAQGIVYGLSSLFIDKSNTSKLISSFERLMLSVPLAFLFILSVGIMKGSIDGIDSDIAYKASNPQNLTRIYKKSLNGEADTFSVPLYLAQNPKTPIEILRSLAEHKHPAVRSMVARHSKTPSEVVTNLKDDNCSAVRNVANKR